MHAHVCVCAEKWILKVVSLILLEKGELFNSDREELQETA